MCHVTVSRTIAHAQLPCADVLMLPEISYCTDHSAPSSIYLCAKLASTRPPLINISEVAYSTKLSAQVLWTRGTHISRPPGAPHYPIRQSAIDQFVGFRWPKGTHSIVIADRCGLQPVDTQKRRDNRYNSNATTNEEIMLRDPQIQEWSPQVNCQPSSGLIRRMNYTANKRQNRRVEILAHLQFLMYYFTPHNPIHILLRIYESEFLACA